MRCADKHGAFVQPALYEAFGLTVVEAMSCGLPTFATIKGGPAEVTVTCLALADSLELLQPSHLHRHQLAQQAELTFPSSSLLGSDTDYEQC